MSASASLVLDTHVIVWLLNEPERVSAEAIEAVRAASSSGARLYLSAFSLIELTFLTERGRILPGIRQSVLDAISGDTPRLHLWPVDVQIAQEVNRIPRNLIPEMPDRIIAATALALGLPLVTRDKNIRESGVVTALW